MTLARHWAHIGFPAPANWGYLYHLTSNASILTGARTFFLVIITSDMSTVWRVVQRTAWRYHRLIFWIFLRWIAKIHREFWAFYVFLRLPAGILPACLCLIYATSIVLFCNPTKTNFKNRSLFFYFINIFFATKKYYILHDVKITTVMLLLIDIYIV